VGCGVWGAGLAVRGGGGRREPDGLEEPGGSSESKSSGHLIGPGGAGSGGPVGELVIVNPAGWSWCGVVRCGAVWCGAVWCVWGGGEAVVSGRLSVAWLLAVAWTPATGTASRAAPRAASPLRTPGKRYAR
jgi:hypothetical protein